MNLDDYQNVINELKQFIALNAEEHRGQCEYLATMNLLIITKMKIEKEQQERKSFLTSAKKASGFKGAYSGRKQKAETGDDLDSIENILIKLKLMRENLEEVSKKKRKYKYSQESAKVDCEEKPKKEIIKPEMPERIVEQSISSERSTGNANVTKCNIETNIIFDNTPSAEMSKSGERNIKEPIEKKMPTYKAIALKPKSIYTAGPSKSAISLSVPEGDLDLIPKLTPLRRYRTITRWVDNSINTMIPTPTSGRSNNSSSIASPIPSSPISSSDPQPKPTKEGRSNVIPSYRSNSIPRPTQNNSLSLHEQSNSQSPKSSAERTSASSNSSRKSSIPRLIRKKSIPMQFKSESAESKRVTEQKLKDDATKRSTPSATPVHKNLFGPQDKREDKKCKTDRSSRAKKSTSKQSESRSHSESPPYEYKSEPLYFACTSSKCPQVQYNRYAFLGKPRTSCANLHAGKNVQFNHFRISVIFRVRSAKAVKITDLNLMKRLGIIVAVFSVLLMIRTLVAPPVVIVGRTADDLKAYLCKTDWWDHSFTTMEVMFLVWGIRLCIVVRKAPSEFNESRFISMAIYNEFLLSLFLNISMLFLQSPANPDLLYIIFFCHTQLTVTLLLCLIFGSKAYMVFRGTDKTEESSGMMSKSHATKFLNKPRSGNSQYTSTNSSAGGLEYAKFSDQDVQDEFRRLYTQLELLKEKNMRFGNRHLAAKISAMQDAAARLDSTQQIELTIASRPAITVTTHAREPPRNNFIQLTPKTPAPTKTVDKVITIVEKDENPRSPTLKSPESVESDACITCGTNAPLNEDIPTVLVSESKDDSSDLSPVSVKLKSSSSPTGAENGFESSGNGEKTNLGRTIKSGHARTHAIVINLDDKSRFTEEVTV